jgi:hypothetical protein
MESYKLSRWELHTLINLNFDFNFVGAFPKKFDPNRSIAVWLEPDKCSQDLITYLTPRFFKPLLDKKPELVSNVEKFGEEIKKETYIVSILTDTFADKITLEDIRPLLFYNNYTKFISYTERKKFIRDMIGHDPTIMMDLHNHLKTNTDNILLYAYAESLPKFIDEIKDTKESIWENLRKIHLYSDSSSVAIVSPIVRSFKNDEPFYELVKEIFSKKFDEYHALREKFKKVEKKYFSQFKIEEYIDLFDNEQEYRFIFSMRDRVLVDNFGINKNAVMEIQKQIHECLKRYLNKSMPENSLYYAYSNKGFEINAFKFEDKPQVDFYIDKIQPVIKNILGSLPENIKRNPDSETMYKMFDSALLKLELDDTLEIQAEPKPKRNKL